MTDVIGYTHKHLFEQVNFMKRCFENEAGSLGKVKVLEDRIETHLEELRKDRANLVTERDTLRNRVQVLEMANATSGEVIRSLKDEAKEARKASMKARLAEFATPVSNSAENVASAPLDANTATILGALVDAQRIMTDYLVPDGIRAKDAMGKIIPVLDNETLCLAMRAFEKPEAKMTAAAAAQYAGIMNRQYSPSNGEACMHSFHQCYGPRETCTFCGVGK